MPHLLLLRRIAADDDGNDRLGEAARGLGEGIFLVAADLAAIEHGRRRLIVGERLQIFVRIAPDHAVAADMHDHALADAGKRQLPRQRERHRAAPHNDREPALPAKARRNGAEQSPARHEQAKSVGADEPASGGTGERRGRERIMHRRIFGRRHDGRDAGCSTFGNGVAHAFGRRIDQRDIRLLRQVADTVIERQAVHRRAAATERDAADEQRASLAHAGDLTARIAAGRADHRYTPGRGVEERQAQTIGEQLAGHAIKSPGKAWEV
ncbi:MAG: hypothetical protein WB774_05800 [Xanthobacteraceae bacterium]|jgi:hypothetical protein